MRDRPAPNNSRPRPAPSGAVTLDEMPEASDVLVLDADRQVLRIEPSAKPLTR